MKLMLDEHFSPEIARQLRNRGHDVVAARERLDLHGLSDRELLEVTTTDGRTIVTENVVDFAALHREWVIGGRHHAGIVYTSPRRFPRTKRAMSRIVRALEALMIEHADAGELSDQVWWL